MNLARYARLGRSRQAGKTLSGERARPLNDLIAGHARRMARFGTVGLTGVGVNMTVLYLLAGVVGMNHLLGAVLATEAAILSNFLLNDRWTFRESEPSRGWPARAMRYNLVALAGLVISIGVLAGLTYLFGMHYLVANLFAIGAGTLWNYTGSSMFAWSRTPQTPDQKIKIEPRGRAV